MDCSKVFVLSKSFRCISPLLAVLRDKNSDKLKFVTHANRLMALLVEEGLSYSTSMSQQTTITTPTNAIINCTVLDTSNVVAVSIIRAGDSMLDCFLKICPEASVGKILIQRDESTAQPIHYYQKLPSLVNKQIFLLDLMLATGGSAKAAIASLLAQGAREELIIFLSVVAAPEGVAAINAAYPAITLVTAELDEGLNEQAYIVPGLGDYGDRYFGTN